MVGDDIKILVIKEISFVLVDKGGENLIEIELKEYLVIFSIEFM